ncbi:MAG: tetratricopeptide repeat protein [Ignavibacteriaceae bacterium]|jgi:Tfp pilus assembly protein PilF|nr:tetratricopeptide repeat protein [Ignavibacterium sp.]MCC6256551.1 tetratricopeptide repeat protein [Ignavibacteriaceae bacterium]HRN27327.1 tetratricopeptide repeat protein [Ignavibacteriaceae bacterium]HRP93614.1 tetratricopeptide repeat protein [Ignavibacteriaceae bacterium]HRQ54974.1 tetratricopeptide repeat protein [Ignavibacteriaceae bacterium]
MFDRDKIELATEYFNKAYQLHMSGNIRDAIDAYRKSIDYFPTPKAHTFLGWAFSLNGKFQEAIDECKIAIDLDPNFGNPYNDIGSYLINLEQYDEAIYWLEKAIEAPDYEPRYFPFYNLGKVYEKQGAWYSALNCYGEALKQNPNYELAKNAFVRLTAMMN